MNLKIVDLREVNFTKFIEFYGLNGDESVEWYIEKFTDCYNSGALMGSLCVDVDSDEVIGSYLGLNQQLLSNTNLMAAQSIDTLIARTARGRNILKKLAVHYYDGLQKNGFDCVYGLPNKNIEQLRYRILGWNKSRDVYLFISYLPVPLLRLFFCIFNVFHMLPDNSDFVNKQALKFERKYKFCKKVLFSSAHSTISATYNIRLNTRVGLIRSSSTKSFFKKFLTLCVVAQRGGGLFLTTYATIDSETAKIFKFFSFRKRSSPFCGLNLKNNPPFSFGEQNFEFIEFDSFGLL
jgi:hypothetical protein